MKLFAFFAALLLGTAVHALGSVTSYDDLPFSSVQHIETCGHWNDGAKTGQFRVIRVYLYGQDMLFVDLVTLSDDQTRWVVSRGMSIAEFNDDHAEHTLSKLRCKASGESKIVIEGRAESSEAKRFRFRIEIDAAQRSYVFTKRN